MINNIIVCEKYHNSSKHIGYYKIWHSNGTIEKELITRHTEEIKINLLNDLIDLIDLTNESSTIVFCTTNLKYFLNKSEEMHKQCYVSKNKTYYKRNQPVMFAKEYKSIYERKSKLNNVTFEHFISPIK